MNKKVKKKSGKTSFFSNSRNLWLVAFLFPFVLYWNTTFNKYSLDDHLVIEQNEQVQKGFRGIGEILTSPYAEEEGLVYGYRPLVKISFAIEYGIFGENPGINHFFSMLWFAIAMLILFQLLKRLFPSANIIFILLITLIYTAHPIHTEIVASLKNRDEIFMLLFSFLAFYHGLKYTDSKKYTSLIWSGIFFFLALISKNTALPFLIIIPLGIYYSGAKRKDIILIISVLVSVFILSFILPKLLFEPEVRPVLFYENPLFFEDSLGIKLGTAAYILLFYLRLVLFPHPLSFYYGFDEIPLHELTSMVSIISVIIHLGLLFFAIRGIKKRTPLSLGIWIYLLGIVLYSNALIPAPGMVADRFAIVAILGFAIVLVSLTYMIFKTAPGSQVKSFRDVRFIVLLCLIFILPYGIKTFTRNKDWRTYLSLYEADIDHLNNSVKANMLYAQALTSRFYYNNQLGVDLRKNEEFIEKIEKHYSQALELYPENYEALNNFGGFYAHNVNNYEKAVPWLKKATEQSPHKPEAWFNLGFSYAQLKEYSKAEKAYKNALEADPGYWQVRSALGDLYYQEGDLENAIKTNREIIKHNPKNITAYTNIGNYYIFNSDTLSAMRFWEEAVKVYPHKQLLINLSYLHKQYGNDQKSMYYYRLSEATKEK